MNSNQNIDNELSLLQLMQDINCLDQLRPWTDKINIFRVLKISRTEIRHSNMLAWLLDPNENHGLGADFLLAIITDLSKSHSYEFVSDTPDVDAIIPTDVAIKLLSSDLTLTRVLREWNRIDILLKLPDEYIIAIENKVDASEGKRNGKSQLDDYDKALQNNYDKSKLVKIFLSPDGKKPSKEDWKVYTYSDILSILKSVYKRHKNSLANTARILIKNYIEILNNEIMDNTYLKNLCNEIYQKHKQAFDLIYENRESVTSMASSVCIKKLTEMGVKLDDTKPRSIIKFTTKGTEELKRSLGNAIDGYSQYQFKPSGDYGVQATLEIALRNFTKKYDPDVAKTVNHYAEKNGCEEGKDWECKRIWSRTKTFEEVSDEEIGRWVEEEFYSLKKYEQNKGLSQS